MKKLCKGYSYSYSGSIPQIWCALAQLICDSMPNMEFEPVAESYPPRFQKEIDLTLDKIIVDLKLDWPVKEYWPETLSIYPIF
jgi:hypothetical protein